MKKNKNMRKKEFLICFICIIAISLTACEKNISDKKADNSNYNTTSKNTDRIKMNIDDFVQIDATVDVPESLKKLRMNKVKAHRPKLNINELKKIFFSKNKIKKKEIEKEYKSREFGKYNIIDYYGSDDEYLCCEISDCYFANPLLDYYLNCMNTLPEYNEYNMNKYSLTDTLSFASRNEIFKKIKAVYETIGVPISEEYEAYALDYNTLSKEENPVDVNDTIREDWKKENWTKKDDAYYFVLYQEIGGVPIRQIQYGDGYQGIGIEETVLEAIYGARGWISFRERWGYQLEDTKEKVNILSVEEILKSLQKKCSMLTTKEKWKIDDISMELIPIFIKDNDYEIHPVWSLKGTTEDIDGNQFDLEIIFDGITGKEVILQ